MTNKKPIIAKVKGKVFKNRYVESAIIDGDPAFIVKDLKTGKIEITKTIGFDDYILRPLWTNECGYYPYSFKANEVVELVSTEISTQEVLEDIKRQVDRYVDLPDREKILIVGDILITYSMEWISTLHYPFFVGETESGKSTVLHLGRWLNYRCLFSEDIPNADIYNFLGEHEEATGTICEDEAQSLAENKDKIRTYKSSYSKGSKKPRVITFQNKKYQVYYKTFCAKWFGGEKIPRDKGFVERLAIVHMVGGNPKRNIKRATQREVSQLHQIRNKLLMWKIQRVGKRQTAFKTELTGRNQELWEDFLSVFDNTKFYDKAVDVVKYYTKQRQTSITNSYEAVIFKILIENIDENDEIEAKAFWNVLTDDNPSLPGKFDSWNERTFIPDEFEEKLSANSLAILLQDKFQAKKMSRIRTLNGKQSKVTTYCFDRKILSALKSRYMGQ